MQAEFFIEQLRIGRKHLSIQLRKCTAKYRYIQLENRHTISFKIMLQFGSLRLIERHIRSVEQTQSLKSTEELREWVLDNVSITRCKIKFNKEEKISGRGKSYDTDTLRRHATNNLHSFLFIGNKFIHSTDGLNLHSS